MTLPEIEVTTDVREQYYDVSGTTADEIFASIQRQQLGGRAGLAASGLTESHFSYTVSSSTTSTSCRLDGLDLRVEVVVTLPRHSAARRLTPETRTHWKAYATQVEYHEYRHVEIEFQGLQELEERLKKGFPSSTTVTDRDCRSLVQKAVEEQARVTQSRHDDFHVVESRSVRKAQTKLLREIDELDRKLDRDRRELDGLADELSAAEIQRSTWNHELETLVGNDGRRLSPSQMASARDLADAINQLGEEMLEFQSLRNAIVSRYNEKIDQRRGLTTQLSWTR